MLDKNVFPKAQDGVLNVLFCPQHKDIQFIVIEGVKNFHFHI